jgi:hypothetical protein
VLAATLDEGRGYLLGWPVAAWCRTVKSERDCFTHLDFANICLLVVFFVIWVIMCVWVGLENMTCVGLKSMGR